VKPKSAIGGFCCRREKSSWQTTTGIFVGDAATASRRYLGITSVANREHGIRLRRRDCRPADHRQTINGVILRERLLGDIHHLLRPLGGTSIGRNQSDEVVTPLRRTIRKEDVIVGGTLSTNDHAPELQHRLSKRLLILLGDVTEGQTQLGPPWQPPILDCGEKLLPPLDSL